MSNNLAIHGGKKTRKKIMPPRNAFGKSERKELMKVIKYYKNEKNDPQYKGKFEREFQIKFT